MSGINRQGQKVVCVAFINVWLGDNPGTLHIYEGARPIPDEVYTVDGFVESGAILTEHHAGTLPGIALVEIPCALKCPSMEPLGWPIAAFRAIDARETDISEIIRLATPVKQTERA